MCYSLHMKQPLNIKQRLEVLSHPWFLRNGAIIARAWKAKPFSQNDFSRYFLPPPNTNTNTDETGISFSREALYCEWEKENVFLLWRCWRKLLSTLWYNDSSRGNCCLGQEVKASPARDTTNGRFGNLPFDIYATAKKAIERRDSFRMIQLRILKTTARKSRYDKFGEYADFISLFIGLFRVDDTFRSLDNLL